MVWQDLHFLLGSPARAALHPETAHGGDHKSSGQLGHLIQPSFAATAAKVAVQHTATSPRHHTGRWLASALVTGIGGGGLAAGRLVADLAGLALASGGSFDTGTFWGNPRYSGGYCGGIVFFFRKNINSLRL